MFILSDLTSGGIYSTTDTLNQKVVHIFEEQEDAERYVTQLIADDYSENLEIIEVAQEVVAMNCNTYGYHYSIVSKDDLVIPP